MTSQSAPNPVRLADLYEMRQITALTVSPDGSRAAYVMTVYRKKENDAQASLYLVHTGGGAPPHRLTRNATGESAPAFSPDGRYLAFLSTRPDEIEVAAANQPAEGQDGDTAEKPRPQVWVLDLRLGGEPRQVTRRDQGVIDFSWSPDSRQVVFSSRDPSADQKKYLKALADKDKAPLVFRRTQHKHDQHGYLDDVRTHLFIAEVASRAERRLTDGPCDETEPRWSPDGGWIAFRSNRTGDADNNLRVDLWLIRPDASEARRLTHGDVNAFWPRWSPDSRHVAFVSWPEPENIYLNQQIMCVPAAASEPVADLTACVGEGFVSIGGIVPDRFDGDPAAHARVYPVPRRQTPAAVLTAHLDRSVTAPPAWLDNETLVAPAGDRGQTRLVRCTLDGAAGFVFPGPGDRQCNLALMDAAGGTVVFGINRAETGLDLHALPAAALAPERAPDAAAPVRLTAANAALLDQRTPGQPRWVQFPNSSGDTVEALVIAPPDWAPERGPAPLLAVIHGGPTAYDAPGFRFDDQYWAGQGYLLLKVNYRGSISYGAAFSQAIRGGWGPKEHDDLMSGVEHLVQLGWADPQRLFCTGFSYGGIMTNWAVGHTDRFRAAASEHGLWDYVSCFGTDDCQLWWQDDMGVPWQNPEQYRQSSPMSGAAAIRTPLLITAGEQDWRCPPTQGEQLYLALKKRGVPTELVIYQGEHHAISKPRRAIDRIRRISAWLARYGGQPLDDDSAEGYPDQP